MKIKKVIALMLVLSAVSSTTITANASAKDSSFPTDYISSTTSVYSDWRDKENSTSHYIYNLTGIQIRVISYSASNVNRTVNGSAVIPSVSQRFIRNFIWEKYSDHTESSNKCRLSIRSNISGASTRLSGAWSPDSVGSYPVAN